METVSPSSHYESVLVKPKEFLSLALAKPLMSVDTETNGEDIRDGRGYAIGASCTVVDSGAYVSAYFPVAHTKHNVSDEVKNNLIALISSRPNIIMHNAKFDIISLGTIGIEKIIHYYCTMMMCHMLNENVPKKLDWLIKNELKRSGKVKPPEWQFMYAIYGWSPDFPAEIMETYATGDSEETHRLFDHVYPFFKKAGFDG